MLTDREDEEWTHVDEFPHYMISNYGNVKHVAGISTRKVTLNKQGFPILTLYGEDSKTRYLRQINKLVAIAFLRPPEHDDETAVWHIDGDLQNCHASNLKWEMRSRVLEWNEMHRTGLPQMKTPPVKNNLTGVIYNNAFECALAEGKLESAIVWRVEKQAAHIYDDDARYRYVWLE